MGACISASNGEEVALIQNIRLRAKPPKSRANENTPVARSSQNTNSNVILNKEGTAYVAKKQSVIKSAAEAAILLHRVDRSSSPDGRASPIRRRPHLADSRTRGNSVERTAQYLDD